MPKLRTNPFFRCLATAFLLAGGAVPAHAAGPTAKAVFAGGCFWCVESDFDKVAGVISTTSGYTGGKTAAPTYQQVSADTTGHAEAVEIVFDPTRVSYEKLVQHFWRTIDPTTRDRQFCDSGSPYRTNCGRDARLKQLWGDAAAH
jgi:peptide-methionine (S)-S-oxide reductase